MNYTIKTKQIIVFLTIIGVLSLLVFGLINFSEHKFSENKIFNKELKEFHSLLKDGEPAYSFEQANHIVNELIPMIERAVGKKFKKIPEIQLITTKELETILNCETNHRYLNDSNNLEKYEKKSIKKMSKMILGYYDRHEQIVCLLPQRIPVALKLLKLDEKYGFDIAKINIAHELTHALQDQYINLTNYYNMIPGSDEEYAFRATIEGHAVFIEKKIRKQLNIDDFDKIPIYSPEPNQMIKSKPESTVLYNFFTAYADGENFINYHYDKGGNNLIWDILNSPPVESVMIIYPENYCEKI